MQALYQNVETDGAFRMQPQNVSWMELDYWKAQFEWLYMSTSSHMTRRALPIRGGCFLFHCTTLKEEWMSVWRVRCSSVHWSLRGKNVDRWWMDGFGFGSDLAVTPACYGTRLFHLNAEQRAPSFSSVQRAFATIVNHNKAFLKCHSRTDWCARWTQLQMRQGEWCQWPKAMRCWEKTRAVKVFFSFWNAKYSCLGANPPYARYSIMFLADRCSCRFFLDELFVFAARGDGFDVELVFYILP